MSRFVHARALERVESICDTAEDAASLRTELLAEFRRSIRFHAHVWVLTDPGTGVGSAPDARIPCLPELPALIRLKYLTRVNRWTSLASPPVASLRAATDGDLPASALWAGVLSRYAVSDVLSAVFRDRYGCWAFLDLWRIGDDSSFTDGEVAFLGDAAAPVTAAIRRCQAATFSTGRPTAPPPGPVVLMLSPALEVLGQTPETREYLARLLPPSGERSPIPASAYNVAAQLLAVEAGIDAHAPSARVHLSDGFWLTLRAARLSGEGPPGGRSIAVTIEPTPPAARIDVFARAFGLSARETELLAQLASGVDTRELARLLFVSENTVQDHLKSVFAKTGTHSRPTLLARSLGT
ncbi:MAG: Transcriptional regulator [Naasia sp.]|jgi:DNA-binding CsgD family transcriptional regulator|uniref:helix-turn-helix transcriptional regulator n=1 Tax=Naasia sp. TaxID=2546198 RepID=UPI002627F716|nr:LuxR C-terminal-related transcriptional regulator [Naasia sp.]MCU1570590.1 Transcriptional regulator [Naasia sp.]